MMGQTQKGQTVEIQVRIEKVKPIQPSFLPHPLSLLPFIQEMLASCRIGLRYSFLFAYLHTLFITPFLKVKPNIFVMSRSFFIFFFTVLFPILLTPDPDGSKASPSGTIKVRHISIYIALQSGINQPLNDPKCSSESRWQTIANRMVEVISKDEVRAGYGFFLESKAERDAVLVVIIVMWWHGEVGRRGRGVER